MEMAASTATENSDKDITERWHSLNKALEHLPKFQNKNQAGVQEEEIKKFESKYQITLPNEIRAAIKVHDGRQHICCGLGYRLPTTDLLPIAQWKPYEIDNNVFSELLFECIACANARLQEDAREHLSAYMEAKEKSEKSIIKEVFKSLPCELLIIGEGMDDYAEQYLLSIRSGRIYLAIHNIPEWRLIGTFADWIEEGLDNVKEQDGELREQHEDIEVD